MTFVTPDRESTKQRALRVPLNYVHGLDPMQRWKWMSSCLAVVATGVFVWWIAGGAGNRQAISPGPLAHAHAPWEDNCASCHIDFIALRADAANPVAKLGALSATPRSSASIQQQIEQKCQTCHVATAHQANVLAHDIASCSDCHVDHAGRTSALGRPADRHCTRCHESLIDHRSDQLVATIPPIDNVANFAPAAGKGSLSHPGFRSLATDPGNVKFNHQLHMQAGIPGADPHGAGKKLMTLADLPTEFTEVYRRHDQRAGVKPDKEYPVRLDCASCHQPETTSSGAVGAHMQPIRFDQHCRACHPLNYEPSADKQLKHGLTPVQSHEFLLGRYSLEARSGNVSEDATRLAPRRPIPGRAPPELLQSSAAADLDARIAAAERYLMSLDTCGKCHLKQQASTSVAQHAIPDVLPASIPRTWFRHARFDHSKHRAVQCNECHEISSKTDISGPRDHEVVMIRGREVCLRCHAPVSNTKTGPTGGARFDCVECHHYHNPTSVTAAGSKQATDRVRSIDELFREVNRPSAEQQP